MSFRLGLLPLVDAIRRDVAGVAGLDQRPNRVTIITRTWSSGKIGRGTFIDTEVALPPQLPVHQLATAEIAGSGGFYETGDVHVARITPSDGLGTGFTPAQLAPSFDEEGIEVIYRIDGPLAGEYALVQLRNGGLSGPVGGYPGKGGIYSYALVLRARFAKATP